MTPDYSFGDGVNACDADCQGLASLVHSLGAPRCVEVGAFIGKTANAMLAAGAVHVWSIDLWSGCPDLTGRTPWEKPWLIGPAHGRQVLERYCANVPIVTRATPLVGASLDWARRWPGAQPIDLVFIDGNHDYEFCRDDVAAWTPLVRSGGIVCGHDFCDECPGVKRAVEESGPFEIVGLSVWWRTIR